MIEAAQMQVLGMSEDGTRLVAQAPLAYACYRGQGRITHIDGYPPHIQFQGEHVGFTEDPQVATDFLDGLPVMLAQISDLDSTIH